MKKSILLVASMGTWLFVGAGLIYLSPAIADAITHSQMTGTWLQTLNRSGYYPKLAIYVSLGLSVIGTILSIVPAIGSEKPLFSIPAKK
jgi:hypothetical protein